MKIVRNRKNSARKKSLKTKAGITKGRVNPKGGGEFSQVENFQTQKKLNEKKKISRGKKKYKTKKKNKKIKK